MALYINNQIITTIIVVKICKKQNFFPTGFQL
jgi:hypothetical protein